MPTSGLSLVGFMQDQQQALHHLKVACVPSRGKTNPALLADWATAQGNLGPAFGNAGKPSMRSIPMTDPHIQQLLGGPLGAAVNSAVGLGASFQMVEIDPLLAYQFTVCKSRTNTHCGAFSSPPGPDELMNVCLPVSPHDDGYHYSQQGQSFVLTSESLNLRLVNYGPIAGGAPNVIGIQFGWALPLSHVVRYDGRCYLHNGYHRAYGVRAAGATEMPCIFRDVPDAAAVGLKTDGGTFTEALLTSANPPTIGHFSQGRAYDVALRKTRRVLNVCWSDHVLVDE